MNSDTVHPDSRRKEMVDGAGKEKQVFSLSELFDKGAHLFSTRTSDGFEAVEKQTGEKVLLWILRFPLIEDTEVQDRFSRRLKEVGGGGLLGIPRILAYGVDRAGHGFCALKHFRWYRPFDGSKAPTELQRLYLEVLQMVAGLHNRHIVLGDISADSFLTSEQGRIKIVGLLGSFDSDARNTAMLPPPETLHFLAPEQRIGGGTHIASDVYALGVYGYRLFAGRYLLQDERSTMQNDDPVLTAPAPSILLNKPPVWLDDVLGKCLEPRPEDRYHSAQELADVILGSVRSGEAPGGTARWSRRTLIVRPSSPDKGERSKELVKSFAHKAEVIKDGSRKKDLILAPSPGKKAVRVIAWSFVFIIAVLVSGLIFFFVQEVKNPGREQAGLTDLVKIAPLELRPLIMDLTAPGMPAPRRESALQQIAESENSFAHVVLIAEATSRESNLKKTAQRLLVERIRRQGFDNSARVLSQWMDAVEQTGGDVSQYGSAYLSFLHACEKGRPLKSREHFLKKSHEEEPIVAVQLAAALALDDPEQGFFLPILRELIVEDVDDLSIDQLRSKSLGALFVSHQALIPLFGDRSLRSLPEFSDDDLKWAVLRLARYDSMLLVEFSKELIRRRLVPSYSGVFLESLVKSPPSSLTNAVRKSLVKAALGVVSDEEVGHLSRWTAPESEAVLLALCATAPNETAAVEAFDVLSARSLENEPAASLVGWVKSRYWDYRKRLVKAVGIVSLSDRAEEGDLAYAFQAFLPFAKGGSLFRLFIESGSPRLITHSVGAFAAITPVEILLPLLQHGDSGVRLAVVLALKDRNGLGVLQAILRAYEKEGDAEVCRAYHDNHWVTRRPSKSVCNEFFTEQSGD